MRVPYYTYGQEPSLDEIFGETRIDNLDNFPGEIRINAPEKEDEDEPTIS